MITDLDFCEAAWTAESPPPQLLCADSPAALPSDVDAGWLVATQLLEEPSMEAIIGPCAAMPLRTEVPLTGIAELGRDPACDGGTCEVG